MSRFSKLETGDQSSPKLPAKGARPAQPESAGPIYDHGYYLAEADRLFAEGNPEQALRVYSRAVQADHAQVEPWVGQVLCLLLMGQYKEALVWVKRALELFPEDPRVISLQGATYAHQGMVQRGIASSDYAMQKTAGDALVWVLRGEVLSVADNANARFCFDKAMETRLHGDWKVPMLIGRLLHRRRKWAQAADYLGTAAAEQPRNDTLWVLLGEAREKLGNTDGALAAFRTAVEVNPSNQRALDGSARLAHTPLLLRLARRLMGGR